MIDWKAIQIIDKLLDIIAIGELDTNHNYISSAILAAENYIHETRGPILEEKKEWLDWIGKCQHYNNNHYEFYQNMLTGDIVQAQCKKHAINLFGCKGYDKLVKRIFRVTWDRRIVDNRLVELGE